MEGKKGVPGAPDRGTDRATTANHGRKQTPASPPPCTGRVRWRGSGRVRDGATGEGSAHGKQGSTGARWTGKPDHGLCTGWPRKRPGVVPGRRSRGDCPRIADSTQKMQRRSAQARRGAWEWVHGGEEGRTGSARPRDRPCDHRQSRQEANAGESASLHRSRSVARERKSLTRTGNPPASHALVSGPFPSTHPTNLHRFPSVIPIVRRAHPPQGWNRANSPHTCSQPPPATPRALPHEEGSPREDDPRRTQPPGTCPASPTPPHRTTPNPAKAPPRTREVPSTTTSALTRCWLRN